MKIYNILTEEQESNGLLLYDDEDLVYLSNKGKILSVWSARGVTAAMLQAYTQNIFNDINYERYLIKS